MGAPGVSPAQALNLAATLGFRDRATRVRRFGRRVFPPLIHVNAVRGRDDSLGQVFPDG
jgi:hypothetical protein